MHDNISDAIVSSKVVMLVCSSTGSNNDESFNSNYSMKPSIGSNIYQVVQELLVDIVKLNEIVGYKSIQ